MLFTNLTRRQYMEDYIETDWINVSNVVTVPVSANDTASALDFIFEDYSLTMSSLSSFQPAWRLWTNEGGNPTNYYCPNPVIFVNAGIKKSDHSKITVCVAIPNPNSDGYITSYTSSRKVGIRKSDGQGSTFTPIYSSAILEAKAWVKKVGNTTTQFDSGLTKIKTFNLSVGNVRDSSDTITVTYDLYEVTTYDRYQGNNTNIEIYCHRPSVKDPSTLNYSFNNNTNWGWEGTYVLNKNIYNSTGIYVSFPLFSDAGVKTLRSWDTTSSVSSFGNPYVLPMPTVEEYYLDTRSSNFYITETQNSTTPVNTSKIYDFSGPYNYGTSFTFYPKIISNNMKSNYQAGVRLSKYVIQDNNKTLAGRTVSGTSTQYPTGTNVSAGTIQTTWSDERYMLPGNALNGYLSMTAYFSVSDSYNWWYYINQNGTKVYDSDDTYTFSIPSVKCQFAVNRGNTPYLQTASGTRFRNHNAKYAVLANDFDYFEYTWRAWVDYAVDPTVTLTLTYGDQVVATKSMDGTATSPQTFQHGPFLIAPTTQGQLVQISGIVTDARGRASDVTIFTITDNNSQDTLEYLRFYNYNYPTVMVQGYRCLQNGTPDADNGTYIKLTATYAFSQLDYGLTTYSEGTTDGKLKIKLRPHSGTLSQSDYSYDITTASGNKQIMLAVGLNQSVDIDVQVTDFIGNVFDASTEFVPSAQVVLDFREGGGALSIGKRNEFNNALEVAWDTTFYGNVNIHGNVNITGQKQTTTTADAVTYYDSKNLGARTVQAAIDALASRAGVSTSQVQSIVNQAIANLDVPNDAHINQLITTKINNIVFPPSISEARALELINNELANFQGGVDEATVNALIDAKIANMPTTEIAVATANEAKEIAESALTTSETAVTNSTTALTTANTAKTIAEGIEGKADSAIATANNANTTANEAKDTADEAKAIAQAAKNEIDQVVAGVTPTAEEISFEDTVNLNATNVQSAIVALVGKFNSLVNGNMMYF